MQSFLRGKIAFKCGSGNAISASFASTCASAQSWKSRSRSAWSKRWAWNLKRHWFEAVFVRTDGDELRMLPAGKSTRQRLWVRQKMSIRGTCDGNRMGSTPWTRQVEPIMNYGMTIGPSYSTLVLTKWSIAKCSTSSWPWVNFSPTSKDASEPFSRCFAYPAHVCHVTQESQRWMSVTAVLTNIGMVPNRLSCGAMRCKIGVPHICHACRTWTWPLA